jgi:hypothetical protein
LYVLQSDFEKYGDNLPVCRDAALWRILKDVAALGSPNGEIGSTTWDLITGLVRPVVRETDGTKSPGSKVSGGEPLWSHC